MVSTEPRTSAPEYAAHVRNWSTNLLLAAHPEGECDMQGRAEYSPGEGLVVCGCGVFEYIGQPPPMAPPPGPGADVAVVEPRDPITATLALIDPTQFYGPQEIQDRILEVLARLERGALFERAAMQQAAEAHMDFEKAYYLAYEKVTGGAADVRRAQAMRECEALHERKLSSEYAAKMAKATLHNLRAILSGYQSVFRGVMADYQAGGANR